MTSVILKEIRKKSREEWINLFKVRCEEGRSWLKMNPEKGFIIAFIVGIFFILAFRYVMFILFLSAILFLVILKIALPEGEHRSQSEPSQLQKPAAEGNEKLSEKDPIH